MHASTRGLAVYQGLFLIMFALYSVEKKRSFKSVTTHSEGDSVVSLEEVPTRSLEELYRKLKKLPFFEKPLDGIRVIRQKSSILIVLESDELYRSGSEIEISDTWYPTLDKIAESLFPLLKNRFRVTFIGYANEEGQSARFSSERAEWVLRYFEKDFRALSKKSFFISGAALRSNSKRIEIEIRDELL